MKSVVAKFVCNNVQQPDQQNGFVVPNFSAVYSSDPNDVNRAFSDATPSGNISMCIQPDKPSADFFKAGKKYLVTFTEEEEEPATESTSEEV